MSAKDGELWLYFALVTAGFLPHEVWRWVGLALSRGIDETSRIVVWVRAVATSILAGVIAKLTLTPSGVLATTPLELRLGAIVFGFAVFLALRRSVLAGVLAGEAALILGVTLLAR